MLSCNCATYAPSRSPHAPVQLVAANIVSAEVCRRDAGGGIRCKTAWALSTRGCASLTLPPFRGEPSIGSAAPPFSLPSSDGHTFDLAQLRGRSGVVLYFYPRDLTSGCTAEACAFRDLRSQFAAHGALIVGVSPDNLTSHARFVSKHELNFPLLADEGAKICQLYGVWKEKSMYGRKYMGVERTTFLIDRDGVVRKIYPKVSVTGHADTVLKDVIACNPPVGTQCGDSEIPTR